MLDLSEVGFLDSTAIRKLFALAAGSASAASACTS